MSSQPQSPGLASAVKTTADCVEHQRAKEQQARPSTPTTPPFTQTPGPFIQPTLPCALTALPRRKYLASRSDDSFGSLLHELTYENDALHAKIWTLKNRVLAKAQRPRGPPKLPSFESTTTAATAVNSAPISRTSSHSHSTSSTSSQTSSVTREKLSLVRANLVRKASYLPRIGEPCYDQYRKVGEVFERQIKLIDQLTTENDRLIRALEEYASKWAELEAAPVVSEREDIPGCQDYSPGYEIIESEVEERIDDFIRDLEAKGLGEEIKTFQLPELDLGPRFDVEGVFFKLWMESTMKAI